MAQQSNAKPSTVTVDIDGSKVVVPLFGPYGDKALHGSKLVTRVKTSDPKRRKPTDTLERTASHNGIDYWAAQCWAPANDAETLAFTKAKPANVRDLLEDALCTDAGQKSWHENRGGTTTTRVSVDGAPPARLPNTIIDTLRKAGCKVVEVRKEEKPTA
jgi:hypothetical protein